MVSHCANPKCGARFRYLNGGKLFHFDVRNLQAGKDRAAAGVRKQPGGVEHFWLCADCARKMTLHVVNGAVVTAPLHPASRRAIA